MLTGFTLSFSPAIEIIRLNLSTYKESKKSVGEWQNMDHDS